MKKCLYLLTGFCWGIFFLNDEILFTAILVTALTLMTEILVKDK